MTGIGLDASNAFAPVGLERRCWANADPIRHVFKRAFAAAELPYHNPHSFRSTLAMLGETLCRTPEEFKAWSQNLGHEHVTTTLTSYGAVPEHRQAALIEAMARKPAGDGKDDLSGETIRRVLQHLHQTVA